MPSTEFVAVSWQPNELIDEDSLDQISANLTYVRNQAINGKYTNLQGGLTDIGLKLLCGRALITPRKGDTAKVTIHFAQMFTANSVPVVTTSLTTSNKVQIFHTISGIGRFHPSDQGFEARVNLEPKKNGKNNINFNICVNWIAMGI